MPEYRRGFADGTDKIFAERFIGCVSLNINKTAIKLKTSKTGAK